MILRLFSSRPQPWGKFQATPRLLELKTVGITVNRGGSVSDALLPWMPNNDNSNLDSFNELGLLEAGKRPLVCTTFTRTRMLVDIKTLELHLSKNI